MILIKHIEPPPPFINPVSPLLTHCANYTHWKRWESTERNQDIQLEGDKKGRLECMQATKENVCIYLVVGSHLDWDKTALIQIEWSKKKRSNGILK